MRKSPSFPTPHQSITTIEQTAAISTGRETLLLASTELNSSSTHTHRQAERGTKVRLGGIGGEIHTKDKLYGFFFGALIATLFYVHLFFLMASLPASPRGGVFPSYSRRDTEEHEEQGEEI